MSAYVSPEYGKQLFALKTQKKNDSLREDSVVASNARLNFSNVWIIRIM